MTPTTNLADLDGGRLIPLTKGYFAIVDDDDYERLAPAKWNVKISKHRVAMYAMRGAWIAAEKRRTTILMHRAVIDVPEGMEIDHINGNGLDNRKANLRVCTKSQNLANRYFKHTSVSEYRGVIPGRAGNWIAVIVWNNLRIRTNSLADKEVAIRAYNALAKEFHGEFAVLNNDLNPAVRP